MSEIYGLEELLEQGRVFDTATDTATAALHPETTAVRLARELLRVRGREGKEIALVPNAAQRLFEATRGEHNIVVKARQMGITTWVAARFFLRTVTARGVLSVQVAQTQEAAEAIFRIVQRFWQLLPVEMQKGCLRRSRANVRQMIFPQLDSEFRVLSAADPNAGRGLTMQNLHCSEVSRWPGDAAATLNGLRAALAPGGELVMESTPNGASGCFYEEWTHAQEKGVVRHFYPWWLEERYVSAEARHLREDELALMAQHGLSAAQIGFRRTLEANYRGLRVQEFAEDPELCFRSSGDCCFEVDAVEGRLAALGSPPITRRSGRLQIWLPPVADKQYLVAADTAGGGPNGDYAAVQVIELATGMQCAELRQRLGPLELARIEAALGREYTGRDGRPALLVVERNNHGAAVLAHLETSERYPRVYRQGSEPGWLTSAASKPAIVARMGALLVESPTLFLSRRLLEECRTFIAQPGGGSGAAGGAHDDCLMAMAIAQAVRAEWLQSPSVGDR